MVSLILYIWLLPQMFALLCAQREGRGGRQDQRGRAECVAIPCVGWCGRAGGDRDFALIFQCLAEPRRFDQRVRMRSLTAELDGAGCLLVHLLTDSR